MYKYFDEETLLVEKEREKEEDHESLSGIRAADPDGETVGLLDGCCGCR